MSEQFVAHGVPVIHRSLDELLAMVDDTMTELADWRDYEREVGYDKELFVVLRDAVDALQAVAYLHKR